MHNLLSAAASWPETLPARLRACRLPFCSALIAGLLAAMVAAAVALYFGSLLAMRLPLRTLLKKA